MSRSNKIIDEMEREACAQAGFSGRASLHALHGLSGPCLVARPGLSARRCRRLLLASMRAVVTPCASHAGPCRPPAALAQRSTTGTRRPLQARCSKDAPEEDSSNQKNRPQKKSGRSSWTQRLAASFKVAEPLKLVANVALFFFLIRCVASFNQTISNA